MTARPRDGLDEASASDAEVVHLLRGGLLVLAALGIAGTTAELAAIRHWTPPSQLIPWVVLAVLTVAVIAVAWKSTARRVRFAQVVGAGTLLAAAFGVVEHVTANMDAAPLDRTFGPIWDSLSPPSQWWAATNGSVGPSPLLAPAILAQISLCLLLATVAHPALAADDRRASPSLATDG